MLIFFPFCDSFLSLRCEKYCKRVPSSNNVASASIILPFTCSCVGHILRLHTHKVIVCVCVCDCLKSEQPPSASAYGRGELANQPRANLANIKATGCAALRAHQRPRGRSKTACTSPPPTKSVHVDFKNACARNPPARARQNMRSTRRPILWANVRILRGSAAPSSPGKPHSKP